MWGGELFCLSDWTLGFAAGISLGQVIYCTLPQFSHLHNEIITVTIIAHSIGAQTK